MLDFPKESDQSGRYRVGDCSYSVGRLGSWELSFLVARETRKDSLGLGMSGVNWDRCYRDWWTGFLLGGGVYLGSRLH